ncbi:response regulator transcription factor [Paraburkholderia phenoliruptrix]|uniref:response regulator transcription factor n=1 Tax=Paraburkholderia phenoliruptrix TaxID=252970 RepID=UPI0034CE429E
MKLILLVDDEQLPRHALQVLLESESYRVVCAANGADALALLSVTGVDLVVTDWAMPVMEGLQLCQRMRSDALLRAIPILLVSSKTAPRPDGTWDVFLRKPFAPQQLLQTIRSLTPHPKSEAAEIRPSPGATSYVVG